jgi:plasmid stability protein
MSQITIRADEAVIERVRRVAASHHKSMNEYVVLVLDAATNPKTAGTEIEMIRERLVNAGLVTDRRHHVRQRPDPAAVSAAGARAGKGTSLSSIVSADR